MITKRIFQILGILFFIAGSVFAYFKFQDYQEEKKHQAWVATLEHSASKNVQILKDTIEIDYLGEKRTLSIYLPENYDSDSIAYPVLYFMDGQSLFDQKILEGNEWQLDEVLDSLGKIGGPQAIVVGVYNSEDRSREYKPFPSPHMRNEKVVSGDKHAQWIATDLKAWVDASFRTKADPANTIIGGASLSGLMAYYMIATFPEVYGGAIVFSPSLWVHDQVYDLNKNINNISDKKIFLNAGELETPTVESIVKLEKILLEHGLPRDRLMLSVEKDEGHWHMSWQKGFKKAFPWILQTQ